MTPKNDKNPNPGAPAGKDLNLKPRDEEDYRHLVDAVKAMEPIFRVNNPEYEKAEYGIDFGVLDESLPRTPTLTPYPTPYI